MMQNYHPPNYRGRAEKILESRTHNTDEFFEGLKRIGFKREYFAAEGPNQLGLTHHYQVLEDGLKGSRSSFVIKKDGSVEILNLEDLTSAGGNPTVLYGVGALEFLENQEEYRLISKGSDTYPFMKKGVPTDDCFGAIFHYDLPEESNEHMPIEVLVDYVPQEVSTFAIDAEGNKEPYTHQTGIYLRARQGSIVSALRNELHLDGVEKPDKVYNEMLGLELGSDLTQLVELLNAR